MDCKKCGSQILPNYAYCPFCGTITEAARSQTKGTIMIKPENTVSIGMGAVLLGLVLLAASFLWVRPLIGLGAAVILLGAIVLIRGRRFRKGRRPSETQCRYCRQETEKTWKHCCRCGSKIR
jgi:hypothetical protein